MGISVDLLLINPGNRFEQFATLNELATVAQPLGLAMLASYVRQHGYSVAIIDAEAEFWTPEQTVNEVEKYEPKIIGLSAFTTKMTAAGKVLRLIRERMPQAKTVIGGHHASAVAEQTLREEAVNYVVKGEGYKPMIEFLRRLHIGIETDSIEGLWSLRNDVVVDNGRSHGIDDLDELPFAAWDLLPMDKYRAHHWQAWDYDLDLTGFAVIYTSLGCVHSCDYCSVNVVYGKSATRYRSADHVVAEIELLVHQYGIRHIEIIDDTFTLNAHRVEQLCDAIIAKDLGDKLNMWCFARTDTVKPRLMEKMKRAGINWIFMGFESGSDLVLKDVHKRQTVDLTKRANDIVHHAGIHIGGNYVFGLPGDTKETMGLTIELAKDLNAEYANFFVMMPYPGTRFHEMAKELHYPLPKTWGQYGFFAPDALPMRNAVLSGEQILEFRDRAFVEYFGSPKYQDMIRSKFGASIVEFLKSKILSKKLKRTRVVA